MVLAVEFWGPPFDFLTNASANLLVFLTKFGVTLQLGLQHHLASNGAPKGFQGVPNVPKRITKITRVIVNINDGKRNNWFFDVILRLSEALVCFRASGDNFLRSITRATVNKNDGKRKMDFLTLFWDFQKLSFVFAPPGITFCALSPGL